MRAHSICFFMFLFVCVGAYSQKVTPAFPPAIRPSIPFFGTAGSDTLNPQKQLPLPLSPTFYSSHIGFFCQKELQLQKAVKLPVKFRLGSVAYTDKMEGKLNTSLP